MSIVPRLAVVTWLLVAGAAGAAEVEPAPAAPWLDIHTYDPDGPFVSIPAKTAGMATLVVVGGAMAVFCSPFDLVIGLANRGGYGATAQACASQCGHAAANGTYLAIGAPFWLLKGAFWDGPRRLLRGPAPPPERLKPDVG